MLSPWRARNRIHLANRTGAQRRLGDPALEKIELDLFRRNTIDDVACVGDADGDGVDDWLAGIDTGRTSEVALISGSDWSLIRALGLSAMGGHLGEGGSSLAGAGDLDGDGHADHLVGARIAGVPVEGQYPRWTGHVFGYSGKTGGLILDLVEESCALDGGWDATGDAIPDILVGSESDGLALGAFLYSGKDGMLVRKIQGDPFRENVGVNVAFLDDIDGDGCAELAVANHPTGLHVSRSGEVVVYSGATGEKLHTLRSGR